MKTDFELALERLGQDPTNIPYRTLAMLSGPSRAERAAFAEFWVTLNIEARRAIITRMFETSEDSFELDFQDLFRHCLADPDATVRCYAVEGLWEDERTDLISHLLRLVVHDPDNDVRAAAATSLGRFLYLAECEELAPRYAQNIRDTLERIILDHSEPISVSRRALESLAHVSDERIRGLIDWAYEQGDELLRVSAVFAMGRSAESTWSDVVLQELESGSPDIRYEAARACGEIQIQRAVEPLIALTDTRDRDIQMVAIWSLGQIGGDRARQVLEQLAASTDDDLAEAASEALADLEFGIMSMDLLVHEYDDSLSQDLLTDVEDEDDSDEDQDANAENAEDPWEDEPLDLDNQ